MISAMFGKNEKTISNEQLSKAEPGMKQVWVPWYHTHMSRELELKETVRSASPCLLLVHLISLKVTTSKSAQ